MSRHQEIESIIEQAKQQRAEFIGAALHANALPIVLVTALSLILLQFTTETTPQESSYPTGAAAQVG